MENQILVRMKGRNSIRISVLLIVVLCLGFFAFSGNYQNSKKRDRIVFYNVENLFDTYDDSLTNDDEFLPDSPKTWTINRFYSKINCISKVIMAIGEYNPPTIVGLCEVENKFVLNELTEKTNLAKYPYRIVHKNSPDFRGIDVALVFREDRIKKIDETFIRIEFPSDVNRKTRDVLYFKGLLRKDTLHCFVNHWPSRYGGQQKSEEYRNYAAKVLRGKTDSILEVVPEANIVIMGDFNDSPQNNSIRNYLGAKLLAEKDSVSSLVNLADSKKNSGTISYQGQWYLFDQIIVSRALMNNKEFYAEPEMHIFSPEWLLEDEIKYPGSRPFRTYYGPKYHGGFSDHLPVYLDLLVKEELINKN